MVGIDLIAHATQAFVLGVALYVAWHTYTRPTKSNIYIFVFFALMVVIITYTWVQEIVEIAPGTFLDTLPVLLILTLPYVLLRLAQKFSHAQPKYIRLSEVGLLASYALVIYPGMGSPLPFFLAVSYFAATSIYAARQFHIGSLDANGITQKRLRSLSIAATMLGVAYFTLVFNALLEGPANEPVRLTRQLLVTISAVLFLVGFAPPTFIRRAWQEPELRRFLREILTLPRLSSTQAMLDHIEAVTSETVGAPNATVGLWNPTTRMIDFRRNSFLPGQTIGGRAFLEQRPILSLDTIADDPDNQEIYQRRHAFAVIAAPLTTESERLGVIALYSPNSPIFADDDLSLVSLLADHVGVILENHRHLQAQAELEAREEAARLKEDFLSVAAHELKTPLTTIIGTGQYLERRLRMLGNDTPELKSTIRLNRESKRLQALVQGLLDASRIERGQLVMHYETTSLDSEIEEVITRLEVASTHNIVVSGTEGLIGQFDSIRIQQVIENLVDNAGKYSPQGSTIEIRGWKEADYVHLTISDQGIGIDPADHAQIFDRFYRSANSNSSAAVGIGLGLFICREIIQQHGGQIWVESESGVGSIFHISLPCTPVAAESDGTVDSHSGRQPGYIAYGSGDTDRRGVPGEHRQ